MNSQSSARGSADRLFRTAIECVRLRERYARLVQTGVDDQEQHASLRVACLCDEILLESVRAYEETVATESSKADDWWHKANALWHACREYQRRHNRCDEKSRQFNSRRPDKLRELALEFDLEASALLALRLALAAYRKASPGCDLTDRTNTHVA